jgi:hypothetical protein
MKATVKVHSVGFVESATRVDVVFYGMGTAGHGVMSFAIHVPAEAAGVFRCGEELTLTAIDERLAQIEDISKEDR